MGVFATKEKKIMSYIEGHIDDYLEAENVRSFDKYINDFLNLDKYKYNKCLFYNFGNYDITPFSNESEMGNFIFDVFFVLRGATPEALHEEMTATADAFYKMIKESDLNFGGAIDNIIDISVAFYNAGEGDPNLKICAFTFTTNTEF